MSRDCAGPTSVATLVKLRHWRLTKGQVLLFRQHVDDFATKLCKAGIETPAIRRFSLQSHNDETNRKILQEKRFAKDIVEFREGYYRALSTAIRKTGADMEANRNILQEKKGNSERPAFRAAM